MLCPNCHTENEDQARFCRGCGRPFPRCPQCGALLTKRINFCANDGTPIPADILALIPDASPAAAPKTKASAPKKAKRPVAWIIALVIAAVLLVGAALLIGIAFRQSDETKEPQQNVQLQQDPQPGSVPDADDPLPAPETPAPETPAPEEEMVQAMTYAQYMDAPLDTQVIVEVYVQATQVWQNNHITVYAQDHNGGYFIYEMSCSQEDAAKLLPGTKIRVTGYKAAWAGETEIIDATFEFAGNDTYIARPLDVTYLLGSETLADYQNVLASFRGMTVEVVSYKNDIPGDDIYIFASLNGVSCTFCVESALTDSATAVYQTAEALNIGDVVDMEGFLYWYEGVNPHVTALTVVIPAEVPGTPDSDPLQYFIENCHLQYLTRDDLDGFDAQMSRIARNAVYARSGRKFNDAELQNYFQQFDWYVPSVDPNQFTTAMMNDCQIKNIELVTAYEREMGY